MTLDCPDCGTELTAAEFTEDCPSCGFELGGRTLAGITQNVRSYYSEEE